jgi:hypothetical protein
MGHQPAVADGADIGRVVAAATDGDGVSRQGHSKGDKHCSHRNHVLCYLTIMCGEDARKIFITPSAQYFSRPERADAIPAGAVCGRFFSLRTVRQALSGRELPLLLSETAGFHDLSENHKLSGNAKKDKGNAVLRTLFKINRAVSGLDNLRWFKRSPRGKPFAIWGTRATDHPSFVEAQMSVRALRHGTNDGVPA